MKLCFESIDEAINDENMFAVIDESADRFAGAPCKSFEEARELASQDDNRAVYKLTRLDDYRRYFRISEELNDHLLDDKKFVDFILNYMHHGYSPEDIEDTVAYIVETMD